MSRPVEIDFPQDGSSAAYVTAFAVVLALVAIPWAVLTWCRCALDLLEAMVVRFPFKVLEWCREEIRIGGEGC